MQNIANDDQSQPREKIVGSAKSAQDSLMEVIEHTVAPLEESEAEICVLLNDQMTMKK